jgi:hypothetical protein
VARKGTTEAGCCRRGGIEPKVLDEETRVFWWFERLGTFVRCEAVHLPEGGYELRVVNPDGTERVERFPDSADLTSRQEAVERDLLLNGWTGPHGWNL